MKRLILLPLLLVVFTITAQAQSDNFYGTWVAENQIGPDSASRYKITLQIGEPELKTLYPAQLTIQLNEFKGVYELLLVKKPEGTLAIGRNKIQTFEEPFSPGAWTVFLNGVLEFTRDHKRRPFLTVNRIPAKKYGVTMPALQNFTEGQMHTAFLLKELLQDETLVFSKLNSNPWQSESIDRILNPYKSPFYYGIVDTINLSVNNGTFSLQDNNRTDNDSVTVVLNGITIFDRVNLAKPNEPENVVLKPGMNLLCFFAENYGKTPPNTGKLNLNFDPERFALNFADKADISSTVIVAKIIYTPIENPNQNPYVYRAPRQVVRPEKKTADPVRQRFTKAIDSIRLGSSQITLAIWDDAVEDGDTISLSINDEWIVQQFAVKKRPQFLQVTLQPGDNEIVFVANNLGSIPPNTSMLEIIDGKFRKAYYINNNLEQNSSIKIQYEYHPPPQ